MDNETYIVTFINWEKHNPRPSNRYKYFTLSIDFFDDAKIQGLSLGYIVGLVWLLNRCARDGSGVIEVSPRGVPGVLKGSGMGLLRVLTRLQQIQILTFVRSATLKNKKENEKKNKKENEKKNRIGRESEILSPAEGLENSEKNSEENQPAKFLTHQLVEIWNANRKALPQVVVINAARLKKCNQIFSSLTEAQWVEVVSRLAGSEFCNGKNDRGWIANFDFLLKPETGPKALEGAYDNREKHRHDFQKNAEGFYLTNAEKNSYNNQLRLKRALEDLSESEAREKEINPNQDEIFEELKNVNS